MIAAALVALGLVLYTYLGYPLAIGLLARLFPWRGRPDPDHCPDVSICLPVHDGGAFLRHKLESLLDQDYPGRIEILVYSDGSTDDTEAIAERFGVRLLRGARRQGKPGAINHLVEAATGELLLFNDVRQPLGRGAVRALAAHFADPAVGCASGALRVLGKAGSGVYWRYESWIRRQESRFRGVVGASGAIMMVRRRDMLALGPLPRALLLDDVFVPMKLALGGRRVILEERALAYDVAFDDEGEFRRKARTLAGNFQLFAAVPRLLVPVLNPCWFETISHKALRLLAPFLLVLVFGCSLAALASPVAQALVAAQAGGYLVAAAGPHGGRLGRMARTFVVLNAAALVGLWRHLAKSQRVTW